MLNFDLNILKDDNLTEEIILKIIPQGPLSIIGKINSKYKMVNMNISNNMIYGMIENILEFHFDYNIRKEIIRKVKIKSEKTEDQKNTPFLPIIQNCCKVLDVEIVGEYTKFFDLCTSHLQRVDGKSHFNSSTKDYIVENDVYDEKYGYNKQNSKTFSKHSIVGGKISNYYKSPNIREYIFFKKSGFIKIKLKINKKMYNELLKKIDKNKTAYLGNSESVVNLKIL